MASECGRRKQRIHAVEDAMMEMRMCGISDVHINAIKKLLRSYTASVETNSRLYKDNVKLRGELK